MPIPTHFRGVLRIKQPQCSRLHISYPKKGLLSYFAQKSVHCSSGEYYTNKINNKKVTGPVYVAPILATQPL